MIPQKAEFGQKRRLRREASAPAPAVPQRAAARARQHFTTDADLDAEWSGAGRTCDSHRLPHHSSARLTKLGHSLLEPLSRLGLWPGRTAPLSRQQDASSMLPKPGTEANGLMVQIADANDHLEARADLIGRFALNSLEDSARCRSLGSPPRAVLLIQTRRGTINLAVRHCTTSFR